MYMPLIFFMPTQIDVCMIFFVKREDAKNSDIEMTHVASHDQVTDIFNKPLPVELFHKFKKIHMIQVFYSKKIIKFKDEYWKE